MQRHGSVSPDDIIFFGVVINEAIGPLVLYLSARRVVDCDTSYGPVGLVG